jgi:hypothetical protein
MYFDHLYKVKGYINNLLLKFIIAFNENRTFAILETKV